MDACGGYTHTSNGQNCCGKEDCAAAECQYMTETSGEYGGSGIKGQPCCGYQDCHLKECGGQIADSSISSGEELVCCGEEDCHYQKCDGFITVDSKVDDRKDLECCGAENCHEVECDFHTSTNTPTGVQECCGYEDCHYKECEGKTSVTLTDGTLVACCGGSDCNGKYQASVYPIYLSGLPFDVECGCLGDGGHFWGDITIYGSPYFGMFINAYNSNNIMGWRNGSSPFPVLADHTCNPSQYKYPNPLLDYVYTYHALPSPYQTVDEVPVAEAVKEVLESYIKRDGKYGRLRCKIDAGAKGKGVFLGQHYLYCQSDSVFNSRSIKSFAVYGDGWQTYTTNWSSNYGISWY